MPRLVIVDPGHSGSVGHHGEVNRPLLEALQAGGWRPELWADVALEAEPPVRVSAGRVRGVFSGCGYEDPRQWSELGGMVLLARRLQQQLDLASSDPHKEPVGAWLAHSLLPFQILGLARHLAMVPAAAVLLSLMFPPHETLEVAADLDRLQASERAAGNTRVALAALARACRQQGHRLTLAFPSRQQQELYAPLLAATGLGNAGFHPAVVGAGCTPEPVPGEAPPLVLLHWGDHKPGKGRDEALAVLQALLEQPVPAQLEGWGWLFQVHGHKPLPELERSLLQRAGAAGVGLVVLTGEVESSAMAHWLARCPLALLAYDPQRYRHRSSGMLWQWAAARASLELPAAAVGYADNWLETEATAVGLCWHSLVMLPSDQNPADGASWLAALAKAASDLQTRAQWTNYGHAVLGARFGEWCLSRLSTPAKSID